MREGAWINAHTGAWCWITEHASWIQDQDHARTLGMDHDTHARLVAIPWDFNGPGREAILRVAMEAGFIRARGHGAEVTFEFTLAMETALRAVAPFMSQNFGPMTGCRFNDLETQEALGIAYRDLQAVLEDSQTGDLANLIGSASTITRCGCGEDA
jgi:hypothetical protein